MVGVPTGQPGAQGGHLPHHRHSLQDAWQILELAAIHYPDKVAVVDCGNDTRMTYAELHQRSTQLAAWMQHSGIRRGDRIGILARNSSYVMELHFAAAALHAVVVNLNIHLVPTELAYILNDSGPKLIFADTAYSANTLAARAAMQSSTGSCNIVWMNIDTQSNAATLSEGSDVHYAACFAAPASGSATEVAAGVCAEVLESGSEDDGYHMYYTSGTTGRPKGVVLSHHIVVQHAVGTIKEMQLNSHDIWAHLAPMFHLVDVFAVYAITLVGGRHVTYPTFNAVEALLLLERERITVTNVASTMISMMVNNPLAEQLDLTALRVLSCGGSPQSPAVVARAIAVFGCQFFLSYGMTECCGKISMSILPPESVAGMSIQEQLDLVYSSGRPFSLIDVRVIDEAGKDVPKDGISVGEVWVRGPTVFEGYWGLPEATAESFSQGGWFHTGDLATAQNGYIRVIDRKKDMLLVGGENVYTTEVEAVLHAHPAVHQAAVFGQPNRVMGELVVAAVTLVNTLASSSPPPVTGKDLIAWCKERLAEYKVPVAVHIVEKFPTTGSGKIMKTELRKMFAAPAVTASAKPPASASSVSTALSRLPLSDICEKLARYCGVECHAVDAALNTTIGADVLPEMAYVVLISPGDDPAERLLFLSRAYDVRHAVVVCLERPGPLALAALAAAQTELKFVLLHISEAEFQRDNELLIRTALASAMHKLPSLVAALYWPPSASPSSSTAEKTVAATPVAAPPVVAVVSRGPTRADISKQVLAALNGLVDGSASARIAAGDPLMASGVTSTLAVHLVSALESSFSIELPGTLVFDYPSLSEMAEFLETELKGSSSSSAPVDAPQVRPLPLITKTPVPSFSSSSSQVKHVSTTKKNDSFRSSIVATISQHVSELVGRGNVDPAAPLMAAGVTLSLAVQLVSALEVALGTELPGTLVFDYPTVAEMAEFVSELVGASDETVAVIGRESLAPVPIAPEHPLCVITSAASSVPGGTLVPRLARGNDRITLVPLERWDVDVASVDVPSEINLQFGSFLPDVATFDSAMFGVPPAEALLMDPQQRLVMHTFSEALTGHLAGRAAVRETGVYVGVSQLDYARIAYETGSALNTYYATGSHLSVTSGRLSYTHGFKGPALTVDTACSSSLVTTHLAAKALHESECRVAGSIGVNLTLAHSWTRACLRAGMLADDGHCKTMDASAGEFFYFCVFIVKDDG